MQEPIPLERLGDSTFPITACSCKISAGCGNTNHYCLRPKPDGGRLLQNIRICGIPYCSPCLLQAAENSGIAVEDGARVCPSCVLSDNPPEETPTERGKQKKNLQPLDDGSNYLDGLVWFNAMQESAREYKKGDKTTGCHFPGGKKNPSLGYYKDIPDVLRSLYDKFEKRKQRGESGFVQGLQKNKGDKIKRWCKYILSTRKEYNEVEVRSIQDQESKQLADEWIKTNPSTKKIFILPQHLFVQKVIEECQIQIQKTSIKGTCNDYLRLYSILFCEDECRDKIPALLGYTHTTRAQVDGKKPDLKQLWNYIVKKFKTLPEREKPEEEEYKADYPLAWKTPEAKTNIIGYDSYDANDTDRIRTFRKIDDESVITLLQNWEKAIRKDYNHVMLKYQKDTGGGRPNFLHWKERDPLEIQDERYMGEVNSEHLTFIHMFDKQYEFVYVKQKENIPSDIAMDEDTGKPNGRATPTANVLNRAVTQLQATRKESAERVKSLVDMSSQLLSAIQGGTHNSTDAFTTPPSGKSDVTYDIVQIVRSDGAASMSQLEWASKFLCEKKDLVQQQISSIEKEVQKHHNDKEKYKEERNKDEYTKSKGRMLKEKKSLREIYKLHTSLEHQHRQVLTWIVDLIEGGKKEGDASEDESESVVSDTSFDEF